LARFAGLHWRQERMRVNTAKQQALAPPAPPGARYKDEIE
jgi:hypothetical protein